MRATLIAAVLGSTLFLSGCGIKGPLYLPEIPVAPPQAAPAIDADHSKANASLAPTDSK